jgi:hypothetical protein
MKFVGVGVINALIKLDSPKIPPMTPPANGPSIMAPMMTGTCIIVGFIGRIGIYPKGVRDSRIEILDNNPTMAI